MSSPHFTIVIPTRNRLATLKHAIKTCLEQDYENFSVIVANNNCSDGTGDYISSLNDSRVIQLISSADLPMSENWSRVMPDSIALGGYITYLGDDDGLVPGALSFAAKIVGELNCDVISWRKVEYAWPDVVVEEYKNYFWMSVDPTMSVKSSRDFLEGVHKFSCGYDEGPGLYSSFVSARILGELLRESDGVWFGGCSPDIYSSYAIASAVPEYYKCKFGLSVNGASGNSNGTSYMHRPQSEMASAFRSQNSLHAALSHAPSVAVAEADALLTARERLPMRFAGHEFSWSSLILRLLVDIRNAPSRFHYEKLTAALQRVVTYSGEESPEVPDFHEVLTVGAAGPAYGFDLEGKSISTSLDRIPVSNVFEASVFSDTVFPLAHLKIDDVLMGLRKRLNPNPNPNPNLKANAEVGGHALLKGAGKVNVIKKIGRPLVGRLRKYRRWFANSEKIDKWFLREADIQRWMENETLIESAIRSNATRLEKEGVAFEEFEALRLLSGQVGKRDLRLDWEDRYLCLDENTQETAFDRHYIYHPAWAARVLSKVKPQRHTDISSTLNFCAIVSAFIPVDFYDYRPAPIYLSGLNSRAANLLELPFEDDSLESISCMHVVEHVGLGRYGDPIDPEGDIKAIRELCRVLAPGGSLLIAVPVGEARVQFNAHRVYGHSEFLSHFDGLDLVEFALIPDGVAPNGLIFSASEEMADAQKYGCGCYWFKKRGAASLV